MVKNIQFGVLVVPVISNNSLSATYTAPSILPKETLEKVCFSEKPNIELGSAHISPNSLIAKIDFTSH